MRAPLLVLALVVAGVVATCWADFGGDVDEGPFDGGFDPAPGDAGVVADAGVPDAGSVDAGNALPGDPCAPVSKGIVGWFAAEGDARDATGHNHGEPIGDVGFVTGRVGLGFQFSGDGHVSVPLSETLSLRMDEAFTLEAWVKPMSRPDDAMPLSIVRPFAAGVLHWGLEAASPPTWPTPPGPWPPLPGGNTRGHVHDGRAWQYREGRLVLRANEWRHVIQVWDRSQLSLYVDAVKIELGPLVVGISETAPERPLMIGRWDLRPVRDEVFRFHGVMDEVRVYRRALAAEEVEHNFLAAVGGCERGCPRGYRALDVPGPVMCVRLDQTPRGWAEARDACRNDGGDLVSIHSAPVASALFAWCMTTAGTNCWTGGNDIDVEGTWRWSDGTPWDYTDIWSSAPDNAHGGQDCAFIWQNGRPTSALEDEGCAIPHPAFCQRPAHPSP